MWPFVEPAASVDGSECPVIFVGSALQFPLNLLQFGDIIASEHNPARKDRVQDVYKGAAWDIGQLSEHCVLP